MPERWNILYRGPLSSCNYGCDYCPFAKTRNTALELRDDAERLERFISWVEAQKDRKIGILFTPWGEALIHKVYRVAIRRLSHLPHVYRVAIQTNLSAPVDWTAECDLNTAALWTTYHPTQVRFEKFVSRCHELSAIGTRFSVGVVGLKEAESDIVRLREALPPDVYLWINAYKRDPNYYTEADLTRFEAIDPHFRTNTTYHPSLGKPCRAGHTSFTIDGEGDARRCHFIDDAPIGNIYKDGSRFHEKLRAENCPNSTCGCHIGYVHMNEMKLDAIYGDGILERIPK
ncbi:MAG: STM4011 family radical SAM protein [Verrucomicrobiales bacterium]|nr:STM4011 family radical SAM protein [Verrucomicrobiales bacterium]